MSLFYQDKDEEFPLLVNYALQFSGDVKERKPTTLTNKQINLIFSLHSLI